MLMLSRKKTETIIIQTTDGPITVKICKIVGGSMVRIGIDAPQKCRIDRGELAAKGVPCDSKLQA